MHVVPNLPLEDDPLTEIRTQFLMTVRDDEGRQWNIGAGVDTRGRVVLVFPGWNLKTGQPEAMYLPLPLVTATRYLRNVRFAVVEAARRVRD